MNVTEKLITPELAKGLLSHNPINRRIRRQDVAEYARQMRCGLWQTNTGDSIKLAHDNTLLDGQHRLLALIEAGVSLNFLVVEGIDKDVLTVLDTGLKRTTGDVLHIYGIDNSNNIAAALRRYYTLKTGRYDARGGRTASSQEILSLYNHRKIFWDGALQNSNVWYAQSSRILAKSEIMSLYAYFYDIDESMAFKFMDSLCIGSNLDHDSPIRLLRNKLLFSKVNKTFFLTPALRTQYIFKAWKLFTEGRTVKSLYVTGKYKTAV